MNIARCSPYIKTVSYTHLMLTSAGATTLIGCLMASILGVYLAKSLRDKRRPAGDEE